MAERVSDGLLAELQRKMDDGTPRGFVWPLMAMMLVGAVECVSTPEEIAMANEALALVIHNADERAMNELEIQACLAQLQSYLDDKGGA